MINVNKEQKNTEQVTLDESDIKRINEKIGDSLNFLKFWIGTGRVNVEVLGNNINESKENIEAYIQYLKRQEEEEYDRFVKESIENIPILQDKGMKIIDARKHESWKEFVNLSSTEGFYHGYISKMTYEIIEKLENGTPLEEIVEEFMNSGQTGNTETIIRYNVLRYANDGYPFFRATTSSWDEKHEQIAQEVLHEFDNVVVKRQ